MEVYVFFTLIGLGYIATRSNATSKPSSSKSRSNYDHKNNMYSENIMNQVKREENRKVKNLYKKSKTPHESKVIGNDYRDQHVSDNTAYESKLAGVTIPNFKHNNMEPFFGGTKKHNTTKASDFRLETFTGTGETFHDQKKENVCFADINEKSGSSPYMKNDSYLEEVERMNVSDIRNNILPFKQERVGPGLDDGYTSRSNQKGFQPDDREYVMPKNVDELRQGSNPKLSYEGRLLDGQKPTKRGKVGEFHQNRASTFHERSHDNLFKTTGSYLKNKHRATHIVKDTHRKDPKSYSGNIYKNIGNKQTSKLQPSKKHIVEEYGVRNLDNNRVARPDWDYGKKDILVYSNERDLTTTRTYEGNIQSLVKSMIAPIQDALRPTTRQYTTFTKNEFGNLQSTNPSKQTIFDPNDVARTTIKETNIHDTRIGNLHGDKIAATVYDPNEVAKTTIKETLIHDTRLGNLDGQLMSSVRDDEPLKTTVKETLPSYENIINMKADVHKQTVYDPNDVAKTTIKETTEQMSRDGNIGTVQGANGYETNEYVAPNTNKQFTSDNEYMGGLNKENGKGYMISTMKAHPTQKHFFSNNDYYGQADSMNNKPMSYEDIYNATINETKEHLLKGRKPTDSKTIVTSGVDKVNVMFRRENCENRKNDHLEKVYNMPVSKESINITQEKYEEEENRLDPDILKAFHDNPYTKSLSSFH